MRWAARSHAHYYRDAETAPGGLFGIVQGGMYTNLRLASLEALMKLDLPGLAVGGLAVLLSTEAFCTMSESEERTGLAPRTIPRRSREIL